MDIQSSRGTGPIVKDREIKITTVSSSQGCQQHELWSYLIIGTPASCHSTVTTQSEAAAFLGTALYGLIYFSWQEVYSKHHFPTENANVVLLFFLVEKKID